VRLSNFPNPVDNATVVVLEVNAKTTISVIIYERFGNKVATVCPHQVLKAGRYT